MMRYARIVDGFVAEIISPMDGFALGARFAPDFVASLVECPGEVEQGWAYDGNTFAAPAPPEVTQDNLIVYAANQRWQIETGGITVGGAQIATDRDSQAMVNGAYTYVQASGAASVSYKAASGFVTISADALTAIALAVGAHVQACFAVEADINARIKAGDITSGTQIDAYAWPRNGGG